MFKILMNALRGQVPQMSDTERVALEAGDVWIDGELFSGRPDFRRILAEPYPDLTEAERAFLDGPVEEVCRKTDPEDIARTRRLPEEVWELLREHRFFGLGFPEEHGGHGFSALAQSAVFGKLATRSLALSSIVLIPNSVGPGELLLEVGTDAQRDYYLPRLVRGEEIPCFALTEPTAGSDAASMRSRGVLFRDASGELQIRLDWDKRYITLAPIATLLGLAFKLEDPDDLLGQGEDVGITCALVPTSLPGVEIGEYHDPMGIPFPNGPTRGRDVVIPATEIIGGIGFAGRGWQMLMEALSGGRAISLPAQAAAGAKWIARVTGAYSVVRQQFGLSIGRFEGVEEPLARIAGLTYLVEAARVFTCGAVAGGHRPSVVSAILKYNSTALMRDLAVDGMDVMGGAGISRGPKNLLADSYTSAPIGITVEGANILTRTLIVFGQGAIRCHPHAHRLLEAVRAGEVKEFRRALVRQTFHILGNGLRSTWHGLTRGLFAGSPVRGETAKYYRRLTWASARFAFLSDLSIAVLGGQLKFRGKQTGRFADVLSFMFLATAALRRFEAEGRRPEDLPLVRWAVEHSLAKMQESYEGLLANFEGPLLGLWLRGPARLWARLNPMGRPPSDGLGAEVASAIREPGPRRDRLTQGLFVGVDDTQALAVLERAFVLVVESAPVVMKLRQASRRGQLPAGAPEEVLEEAREVGLISEDEADLVRRATAARLAAIEVDSFAAELWVAGDDSARASEEASRPAMA